VLSIRDVASDNQRGCRKIRYYFCHSRCRFNETHRLICTELYDYLWEIIFTLIFTFCHSFTFQLDARVHCCDGSFIIYFNSNGSKHCGPLVISGRCDIMDPIGNPLFFNHVFVKSENEVLSFIPIT
jgi:hypothetical protein